MPKGYLIAQVTVTDKDAYARYAKAAGGLLQAFGARTIVKPDSTIVKEGTPRARTVIFQFESFDKVAGDGVPTVLLADHQTTGGYPKIATVIDTDLDAFSQLRPHDMVKFQAISALQAVEHAGMHAGVVKRYLSAL